MSDLEMLKIRRTDGSVLKLTDYIREIVKEEIAKEKNNEEHQSN